MEVLEALRRYAAYLLETPGTGVTLTSGPYALASESDGRRVDPKTARKILGLAPGTSSETAILKLCRTVVFGNPYVRHHYEQCFQERLPPSTEWLKSGSAESSTMDEVALGTIVRLATHLATQGNNKGNIPFSRNRVFTGRDKLLAEVHATLRHRPSNSMPAVALKGLGGVGKTQAAVEYAYRYITEYTKILWVSADGEIALRKTLSQLATELSLTCGPTTEDRIGAVRHWLTTHEGWLLIVDNAETLEEINLLSKYFGFSGRGAILITTRTQAPGRFCDSREVDTFEPPEGGLLLERRTGRVTADRTVSAQASTLSFRMGGLALALEQAAAYIEQRGISFEDYLRLYEQNGMDLLKQATDADYGRSVYATFAINFAAVAARNALAASLLKEFSMCPADGFPVNELFGEYAQIEFRDAIWTLRDYSLIKWDSDRQIVSMHRLVQEIARDSLF